MIVRLKDVCKEFLVPMRDKPTVFDGDIPWCRIEDIEGRHFNRSLSGQCVSEKTVKDMNLTVFPTGTVICSCSATLGAYAINTKPLVTNQTFIGIVCDEEKIYNKWLYYRMILMTKKLRNISIGTTIPYIPRESFENLEIDLPSIEEQHKIADKLWNIDSKIENNNLAYNCLNNAIKSIFEYWFFQFEFPNENGKPYKSSGGKMIHSDNINMEIPEHWRIGNASECITHINTGLNPRDNFVLNDGDIRYVTVKNLTNIGILDFSGCDTISAETKLMINKRSKISVNDILFASIAPLGRCYLIQDEPTTWEINESVFSVRPNCNVVSPHYLYMFLTSDYFVKLAEHSSTGSIFSGIRISALQNMKIIIPDLEICNKFTQKVRNLFFKQLEIQKENEKLNSLRNFLLPMFFNGQLKI